MASIIHYTLGPPRPVPSDERLPFRDHRTYAETLHCLDCGVFLINPQSIVLGLCVECRNLNLERDST
jgi:hypothetical protein